MKKFIMQEISKGMILILILLSAISVFLEYRYTKERERLDEVKSIYEGGLSNHVILYSGKDKNSLVPINDMCIGYNHHHAFEKNGIMSVYIGSNQKSKVFFKMTIVPISGRVLIIEEKG